MSHLSTIIERVKRRLEVYDKSDDPQAVYSDPLFEQSVINLMEYNAAWQDQTPQEAEESVRLYDKHRQFLKGKEMPSHEQRLERADIIRAAIHVGKMMETGDDE
jgi:hypothetical protein